MPESGRLKLGDNYGYYKLYSTTVMYLASKAIEFSKKRKKRLLRCSRSFKVEVGTIESPYVTSYWCLIVNDNLSHTAAELSQLTD